MIILIILIIVLLLIPLLINKTLKKKENALDEVKLRENTIKNDGFALMLQQEDGTYEESKSSKWPTDMLFNAELSGCMDANGNRIENALSYNDSTNSVKVRVNGLTYCYVYFDVKKPVIATDKIIEENKSELWDSQLEGDGYRYIGTNPNNYICFGTSDKDTCLNDIDKYMYRIIGIFDDENGNKHLKLIKRKPEEDSSQWYSRLTYSGGFNGSDLMGDLYYIETTMSDNWLVKITDWNYVAASTESELWYSELPVKEIYLHELNRSSKANTIGNWEIINTKISLMYASDYALSLGEEALNYIPEDDYSVLEAGWIHLSNNLDTELSWNDWEWTMTYFGALSEGYMANYIDTDGNLAIRYVDEPMRIRPVFYLKNDIELIGGYGSIAEPYLIK